jgi:hypothetical protein
MVHEEDAPDKRPVAVLYGGDGCKTTVAHPTLRERLSPQPQKVKRKGETRRDARKIISSLCASAPLALCVSH